MRRLPPLGTLRAFEATARHLSFKEAANELGITPTAIAIRYGCSRSTAAKSYSAVARGR